MKQLAHEIWKKIWPRQNFLKDSLLTPMLSNINYYCALTMNFICYGLAISIRYFVFIISYDQRNLPYLRLLDDSSFKVSLEDYSNSRVGFLILLIS